MNILRRVRDVEHAVALETTLLAHGVPQADALALHDRIDAAVRAAQAHPALIGVIAGTPVVGLAREDLSTMLGAGPSGQPRAIKVNTSNLGVAMARQLTAATTVSTTIEIAARCGISYMATGGIGGVHRGYGSRFDVSADLLALARFPVAVVTSGVKSLLDVAATREALETLGIPVIGFGTDSFPAFYQRVGLTGDGDPIGVDARFDDARELDAFVRKELIRTGRGIVIAHPVPETHEIPRHDWNAWLALAENGLEGQGAAGRDVTPALLAALHQISHGATLRANVELVVANASLAGRLATPK